VKNPPLASPSIITSRKALFRIIHLSLEIAVTLVLRLAPMITGWFLYKSGGNKSMVIFCEWRLKSHPVGH
jgi:hypothetical protein